MFHLLYYRDLTMIYQRVSIEKFGGPEVLKVLEEKTLPEPQEGQVRIKVLYTSANFTDVMIRKGKYPDVNEKPPFSPGYDMVGIVDKPGPGTNKFEVGQRVADMPVIGAYSEYICLPEENLIPVPEDLDSAEAVSLILSFVTAYQMLHRIAKIEQGQCILVHGASGAVGTAFLQLGKLQGLEVYGTASKQNHELVSDLGAIPIDYSNEDFVKRIQNLTGEGVDAVFDPIGGKHFNRSFKCLKPGGKLVAFGFYNAVMGRVGNAIVDFIKLFFWNILPNKRKTKFYSIGSLREKHPDWFKQDLQTLFKLLKEGQIKPVIADHYPLQKAKKVHKLIESKSLRGKIIFDLANRKR